MKSKITLSALAAVVMVADLLMISAPAFAHHGTGISYDLTKLVTVKGVITDFTFLNPHSQLYWDAKDEKGNIVHWSAEMNSPGNMERAGWNRRKVLDLFKPGAEITVSGFQSRAGTPVVVFSKAVLGDGREFKSVGGPGKIE
jgi:hypothetical protein